MFFAIAAAKGLIITTADTSNAYQQSPPPTQKCYMMIDDAFRSWYHKRHGVDLDPKTHVVPLEIAMQGHPEAGALWETMIIGILEGDELGFKSTTHERNLYHGMIDGEVVLVCCMVDGFAIALKNTTAAEKLVAIIDKHATTGSQGTGVSTSQGLHLRYNGVDIHQTRDYIKLSCETYLDRVLQMHGWEQPGARESDRHDSVLMSPDAATALMQVAAGPAEGTSEHRELETSVGFGYRQVLGKLVYAYVVCRLDIGFAITLLS
jgi:hypothetical protein